MRGDALGMFWRDEPPPPRIKKEKPKRIPPERTWESPDYLPFIEEARAFNVQLYDENSLIQSCIWREKLIFDIESYDNYFLIAFRGEKTGKIIYFEFDENSTFNDKQFQQIFWIITQFTIIGFNSKNYDLPILALALAGKNTCQLKLATDMVITGVNGELPMRPQDVLRSFKVKKLQLQNHIDLIEVAPLDGSLKIYSGRLHCPRIQDLPYSPDTVLTADQKLVVRWYCINDLLNTDLLYKNLEKAIQLREEIGKLYGVDLRSHSDAQIAEAIISAELQRTTGKRPQRPPEVAPGSVFRYDSPSFLKFTTPNMRWVIETVKNASFIVGLNGHIGMPDALSNIEIPIGSNVYRMGIGGLHSSEKTIVHKADKRTILSDRDVKSYYPWLILNLELYPQHLGREFLSIYRSIVERRLAAKESGDILTAETLKITVNGSFGKTGNKYSILYEPRLVIQITITGQLTLLMLIERLELAGIPVVSANTDGVVIKCPVSREADMNAIVKQWERDTNLETEEVRYSALYSRDVNNYIALKEDGSSPKVKGAYSETDLSKNPQNGICIDAVLALLTTGKPIDNTIRECKDIRKFISLRKVRRGAVKDGRYLGGIVRWYYAQDTAGEIIYALTGNKVPKSDGAKPLQDLPQEFPSDINYDWYVEEAQSILYDIGYSIKSNQESS